MTELRAWFAQHGTLMAWLGVASAVMFVAGVVLLPVLVARMRSDYFLRRGPPPRSWLGRHPVFGLVLRAARNVLGVVLVLAGIAMLVLPGQGILTILVGLGLLDVPGKRRLELAIVRRAPVRKALDWLRARAGRPPLQIPPRGVRSPPASAASDPGEGPGR